MVNEILYTNIFNNLREGKTIEIHTIKGVFKFRLLCNRDFMVCKYKNKISSIPYFIADEFIKSCLDNKEPMFYSTEEIF